MNNNSQKLKQIALLALSVLALVMASAVSAYRAWEEAPATAPPVATASPTEQTIRTQPLTEAAVQETPWPSDRQKGTYTILLVGNDDGNYNTDTIMVGKIDTEKHTMDFVSIPRDTLVNWDWDIRKINAVYWSYRLRGDSGIDALKEHVKNLIGFEVDCYAVLDIGDVIRTVDALGGVDFDVPMDLNYDDISQNLHIHIPAGLQHLNGEQAMGVCRYRSGYYNGDLGRINMQHQFLKACARQFISLGSIPHIAEVADILTSDLDTDLTAANIAFFLRQALLCDSENIRFYTVPNRDATVHGLSYTIVDLDEWIPLVNEVLNPYFTPVTQADLDVVYLQNGDFAGTMELKGPWYFYWQPPDSGAGQSQTDPEPAPEPDPGFQLPEFTFPPLPGEGSAPDNRDGLIAAFYEK